MANKLLIWEELNSTQPSKNKVLDSILMVANQEFYVITVIQKTSEQLVTLTGLITHKNKQHKDMMVNHTPHGKIRNSASPIDIDGIRKDSIEWLSHHGEVGSVLHELQRGGVQVEVSSHVKVQCQPRKTPETLHPITQPTQQHQVSVPNILALFLLVPLLNHNAPRHHRQHWSLIDGVAPRHHRQCGSLIAGVAGGVAVVQEKIHRWQRRFCPRYAEWWHVPHQWVLGRNSVNHGFGIQNFPVKRNNG